jgi:hypothetical protein
MYVLEVLYGGLNTIPVARNTSIADDPKEMNCHTVTET